MKIGIVGAGKWGQGLRHAFLEAGHEVVITSRTPREIEGFTTVKEVLACDYVIIVIATQSADAWMKEHFAFKGQKLLIANKGIEVSSGRFLNQIFESYVPKENLAYLSGPSFAVEVLKGLPTALVVASTNEKLAGDWMGLFPRFIKTYRSDDVVGVEVAGAYKNVIAIAAGVSDALELGNNARAAMITRGIAEISRFGLHFGATSMKTFLGLAGVGDLFLTASSTLSRNYRVGYGLGRGKTIDAILEELGEVAEGVPTAHAIVELADREGLYQPIAAQVSAIIRGKNPQESLHELLTRTREEEF